MQKILLRSALLLLTICSPGLSNADPAKAVPINAGEVAHADYACFDVHNMRILAGQVAACEAAGKTIAERDAIIQAMMENSEPRWYRNGWLWFAVGLAVGAGGVVTIQTLD